MDRQEAIQIIKNNWPNGRNMLSEALEFLIPELKESEDERVRKVLVDFFKDYIKNTSMYLENVDVHAILAWLEKQGEQKQKQYDIDILEKHITKDPISELAHTVIVRNGWEIVDAKKQKQNVTNIISDLENYFATTTKEQQENDWEEIKLWEKQHFNHNKHIEQKPTECRQETKPNGGIVYEDFNDGDGYYKVNLEYLSKSQVELLENLVASWQDPTNNK